MQPTIAVTASAEGMITINGRFAGEAGEERPLLAPVAAFGPIYLEYRPLRSGLLPSARKLVMSGGRPLTDSVAGAEDLFVILWPGSVTEIEFIPQRLPAETAETFSLDGQPARLVHSSPPRLETAGMSFPLPAGAELPEIRRTEGGYVLTGPAEEGQYLLTLNRDGIRRTGFLRADSFKWESPDTLRAVTSLGDLVGHGTLERWQVEESGLRLLSSEPLPANAVRPDSPETAARLVVEAALLNRFEEAEALLAPDFAGRELLETLSGLGEWCLPMKYAPPGAACIGLMHLEEGSLAIVRPLYYRAESSEGNWRLTELRTDE